MRRSRASSRSSDSAAFRFSYEKNDQFLKTHLKVNVCVFLWLSHAAADLKWNKEKVLVISPCPVMTAPAASPAASANLQGSLKGLPWDPPSF